MRKNNKFEYEKIIQQHYGCHGWEDVSFYPCNASGFNLADAGKFSIENARIMLADLAEYRRMEYPTRLIFRRTRIEAAA